MSDRTRRDSAGRRGRRAYWAGTAVCQNPMRARDSQIAWEQAWRIEEVWDEETREALARLFRQRKERKESP